MVGESSTPPIGQQVPFPRHFTFAVGLECTRAGKKKPTYELAALRPIDEPPAATTPAKP